MQIIDHSKEKKYRSSNAKRVIPLSSHAVTRNGPSGGSAWYPTTFLAASSWSIYRICPRSLVLSIFKSVIFTFTTLPFSFHSLC